MIRLAKYVRARRLQEEANSRADTARRRYLARDVGLRDDESTPNFAGRKESASHPGPQIHVCDLKQGIN